MLRLYTADAYGEGYRAFLEGKAITANPYAGTLNRLETDWRVGWRSARADRERIAA